MLIQEEVAAVHLQSHLVVLTLGRAPRCQVILTPQVALTDALLAWHANNDQTLLTPADQPWPGQPICLAVYYW